MSPMYIGRWNIDMEQDFKLVITPGTYIAYFYDKQKEHLEATDGTLADKQLGISDSPP